MTALLLILAVPMALLNGWVLSILWRWYLVPVFGLPPLNIPQAIGVALVVGYLTKQYTPTKDGEEPWVQAVYAFIHPLMALVFGWLLSGFVS